MFFEFLVRLKIHAFVAQLSDGCFCSFVATMLQCSAHLDGHQHGVSIQISINLGKYGESLCIFTFFLFLNSRLYLLNSFDFFLSILNGVMLKISNWNHVDGDSKRALELPWEQDFCSHTCTVGVFPVELSAYQIPTVCAANWPR